MKFVVIGAGAWGTAFAVHLVRRGHDVVLVPRRPEQEQALTDRHENVEYLPGVDLPSALLVSADTAAVLSGVDVILLACPAQALRETSLRVAHGLTREVRPELVLSLAKGLELGSHRRPSEVVGESLPGVMVGSLSGPTNALGVARGDPSAMVMAAAGAGATLGLVQSAISSRALRVYTSDDIAGVEYGGCLKNIYAIAAGCCDGLKLGDNTKAALLTRALTEMVRVGVALGAKAETFYGLSGFGDLVATCYGAWSRNREFGQKIGEGRTVPELMEHRRTVVEGFKTAQAFAELCDERGLEAPILREVQAILSAGRKPADAIAALMTRELKRECGV